MWQEDVTALVRVATGSASLLAVRVPAGRPGDWACVPLGPVRPTQAQCAGLQERDEVAAVHRDGQRWVLTLTDRARGSVVPALLDPAATAGERRQPDGPGPPAEPPTHSIAAHLPADRLYPARLAHARTRMLARSARAHAVGPSGGNPALARMWRTRDLESVSSAANQRLLLALAGSRLARRRATDAQRPAPTVASLRDIAAAFEHWFSRTRLTPRGMSGSAGAGEDAMMEAYALRLGLATAVGSALRAGLTDLGLDSPEHL